MNKADEKDLTPVQYAARKGHADRLKLLLEAGADARAQYALRDATESGYTTCVRLLLEAGADMTRQMKGPHPSAIRSSKWPR